MWQPFIISAELESANSSPDENKKSDFESDLRICKIYASYLVHINYYRHLHLANCVKSVTGYGKLLFR